MEFLSILDAQREVSPCAAPKETQVLAGTITIQKTSKPTGPILFKGLFKGFLSFLKGRVKGKMIGGIILIGKL